MPPPDDLSQDKLLATLPRDADGRPAIGGYSLLRKIGVGGMGAVYHALNPRLKREVAIKILPFHLVEQEQTLVTRFQAEARMAAQLDSPHVVQVLDVGEDTGLHYFVMQFVAGESAGGYLKRVKAQGQASLPERDALDIVTGACRGLAAAHQKGIVHRDVKPDNILIPTGRLSAAKIADLGLAKPEGSGHTFGTLSHVAMGTPGYMAPEQAEDARTAGAPADVFALGATFYALIAGRPPFVGTSLVATLRAAAEEDPPELPATVSPAVKNLIGRCLEKDPPDRYPDCIALLAALERVIQDPITGETPSSRRPDAPRRKYRIPVVVERVKSKAWIGLVAGAVAIVLVAAVIALRGGGEEPSKEDPSLALVAQADREAERGQYEKAAAMLQSATSPEAAKRRALYETKAKEKRERAEREVRESRVAGLMAAAAALEDGGKLEDARSKVEEVLAIDASHAGAKDARSRLDGRIAATTRESERLAAYRAQAKATEDLIREASEKRTPEAWRKVVDALEKALALASEKDAPGVRDAVARAKQRVEWTLAVACERDGKLGEALEHVVAAVAHAKPSAELERYRESLERRKAGLDDRAARKKEHDETVAKASTEADPEKALALWRRALELADDPKDRDAAEAKVKSIEAAIAAAGPEKRYADAMKAAVEHASAGRLDEALAKYKEALEAKPGDRAATDAAAKVEAARKQKAYDAAMAEGKAALANREWANAKTEYERALAAKPGDFAAKKGVGEAERGAKESRATIKLDDEGRVKMDFILVKAGTFTMGWKDGRAEDQPPHEVVLTKDFFLGVTEVTQLQWETVMGRNDSPVKSPELPMSNLSWDDAMAFVKKLNLRFKAERAGLPSEAEWEYACRAGHRGTFYWGDDVSDAKMNEHMWHEGNSSARVHPVGEKKPNAWGFHDMAGNVWEWCADAPRQYREGRAVDPFGSTKDTGRRCFRGGSATNHPHDGRAWLRQSMNTPDRGTIGFRLVLR